MCIWEVEAIAKVKALKWYPPLQGDPWGFEGGKVRARFFFHTNITAASITYVQEHCKRWPKMSHGNQRLNQHLLLSPSVQEPCWGKNRNKERKKEFSNQNTRFLASTQIAVQSESFRSPPQCAWVENWTTIFCYCGVDGGAADEGPADTQACSLDWIVPTFRVFCLYGLLGIL